jgi:predicted membrane-bound mannosyltransferase
LCALAAAVYFGITSGTWKITPDSAIYVGLAEALADGRGYTFQGLPVTKYPPGLPIILSGIISAWGRNYWIMKAVILATGWLCLLSVYWLLRHVTSERVALIIAVLTGISVDMLSYATLILTDVPYMFFSLTAIGFLVSMDDHAWTWRRGMVAIGLILAAWLFRAVAILLPLAWLGHLFLNRRGRVDRLVAVVAAAGLCIIVVALWAQRGNRAGSDGACVEG